MSTITKDNTIIRTIELLTASHDGALYEIRIPNIGGNRSNIAAGFFEPGHVKDVVDAVKRYEGKENIYIMLNPVASKHLFSLAANRIKERMTTLTKDSDIQRRVWLYIDVDTETPVKNISATDEEKGSAHAVILAVRDYLTAAGWSEPIFADSGNGYHLLYRVELPNSDDSAELVKSCLAALAAKFNNGGAKVDTSVCNASRISKLYGTMAVKGDSTEDRPHRRSQILSLPEALNIIPRELLENLAATAPATEAPTTGQESTNTGNRTASEQWLENFMERYGIEVDYTQDKPDKKKYLLKVCPFDPDPENPTHTGKDVALFVHNNGVYGFRCLHAHCADKKWRDVREKFEPGCYDRIDGAVTKPSPSTVEKVEVKPLHDRLQEKLERDRQRKQGELLGYRMKDLGLVAEKCDGIQPGFYIIGAYTNIGKTALLVNMFLDLLRANPETTGIYFSLDDNEDIIINRFLGLLSGLPINACQRPSTQTQDKESLIDNAYAELIDFSKEGRLFLYDIGSVNHINGFKNIILEHSDKKLIIAIDGLHNLQVGDDIGYGNAREENKERANQVKAMVDMWKIPVLTTAEVRKPQGKNIDRPTLHDLMETSKFAYNANLIWTLHPPALKKEEKSTFNDEVEKFNQDSEPIVNLWYEKNKMSEFKGLIELKFKKTTGTMSLVKDPVFRC